MSIKSVAEFMHLKANVLNDYYKNHLSGFHSWNQKKHSEEFTLYACNLGEHLAIDESSLSNGELYTIVTNKDGHGRKGTLVAMVKGVKSDFIMRSYSVFLQANVQWSSLLLWTCQTLCIR